MKGSSQPLRSLTPGFSCWKVPVSPWWMASRVETGAFPSEIFGANSPNKCASSHGGVCFSFLSVLGESGCRQSQAACTGNSPPPKELHVCLSCS